MLSTGRLQRIIDKHGSGVHSGCKHIAIAVRKKSVVAIGVNNIKKTHPENLGHPYVDRIGNSRADKVGVHAEMSLSLKLKKTSSIKNIRIYVLRIRRDGRLAYSKPCQGCQQLLESCNYKEVLYSLDDGTFKAL